MHIYIYPVMNMELDLDQKTYFVLPTARYAQASQETAGGATAGITLYQDDERDDDTAGPAVSAQPASHPVSDPSVEVPGISSGTSGGNNGNGHPVGSDIGSSPPDNLQVIMQVACTDLMVMEVRVTAVEVKGKC